MVRCADCGLLSVRDPKTQRLEEADDRFRASGTWSMETDGVLRVPLKLRPMCSAMQPELNKQLFIHADKVLEGINGVHDCPSFTQWSLGFTPKEHRQMMFDLERTKQADEHRQSDRRFQFTSTLISAAAGAVFTAVTGLIFGWLSGLFTKQSDAERLIQAIERLAR